MKTRTCADAISETLTDVSDVVKLRDLKIELRPMKKLEKKLVASIKSEFEIGSHTSDDVQFTISESSKTQYDAQEVRDEFPGKIGELFKAGVFTVDSKKFAEWAEKSGWDIEEMKHFKISVVLDI